MKKEELLKKYKNSGLKYFDPEKIKVMDENPFKKVGFSGEDFESLRESIKANGVLHPIFIKQDGTCLSGNRRLVICQELGILVPGIQFTEDLPNEAERVLVYHPNTAVRQLSASDKEKMLYDRFKDIIGAPKSLPMIARLTGLHISTVKTISAKFKKIREYEKLGKTLTESDYKANLKYFVKLEEVKKEINSLMLERSRLIKKLEESAPLSVWMKWKRSRDKN